MMLFGLFRTPTQSLRSEIAALRHDVRTILSQQVNIMSAVEDLKAAASRLESTASSVGQKLDADAATQKDLVAQIAALASRPQAATDEELKPLVDRFNAVADGLSGHLAPVVEAASGVSSSVSAAASGGGGDAPQPDPSA